MVLEGIVIHKIPYKERDLIAKLLLRNGSLGSFYVYGGQGGGKLSKPVVFEPGAMMRVHVKERRSQKIEGSNLMVASEYERTWMPQHIRHDVHAFYLTCLFFEVLQRTASEFNLWESEHHDPQNEGIFSVTSNALYYLEAAAAAKTSDVPAHLMLFMVKLLFHLGVMPETDRCSYCASDLNQIPEVSFLPGAGSFACRSCAGGENHKLLWYRVKKGYQTRYQDYEELHGATFSEGEMLLQFLCHHFNLRVVDIKSYKLLFK